MSVHWLRNSCALVVAVLAVLLFCAPQAKAQTSQGTSIKIGYSMDSLAIERWQTDLDIFQKRAKELGAEVLVETAEGDDELQFKQAQKLLDAGIKVLVLVPHNTDTAARIVNAAKARHVPVLSYDRLVRNCDVDFFVGFDGAAVGRMQATALMQRAPKGNYVLAGGSLADNNAKIVRDGQMAVLKPLIDRGDIKIVADFWATDWSPVDAYTKMANVLASSKDSLTAVVASNDGMAGGIAQALEDRGLAGKVLVSGQDADLAAILRILSGTQTMTVYKSIVAEARRAAEVAVSLTKGEPIERTGLVSNGAKNVPAILLDPIAVTKENIKQTVIKDGFQSLETIQKSLPKDKWPQ
jgi:D-xylose transport system substrate-binding protein